MNTERIGSLPEQEHVSVRGLEKLYTEKDLEAAGIASRSKLRKDRMKGVGIPFVYIGRLVRYRESDVKEWLAANQATCTMSHNDAVIRAAETARMAKVNAARAAKKNA